MKSARPGVRNGMFGREVDVGVGVGVDWVFERERERDSVQEMGDT